MTEPNTNPSIPIPLLPVYEQVARNRERIDVLIDVTQSFETKIMASGDRTERLIEKLADRVDSLAKIEARINRLESVEETRRAIRVAQWTGLGAVLTGASALILALMKVL